MVRFMLRLWVVALLAAVGAAEAAVVQDIRMWHAPDRSRIVFDMDAAVRFKVFTLRDPDRVVIDLPATQLQSTTPGPEAVGQFIHQIRFGQPQPGDLRAVFDVKKPVRYTIRLLKPVDNYRYRLVVDYYHRDSQPERQTTQPSPSRKPGQDLVILIDPGHGGEDPGALGSRSQEKAVVLRIAQKLKQQIDRQDGMRAELTRTGDYYVRLRKRIHIARQQGADLFISLHADAFKNKEVRGASVYALSQRGASSETARWLANKENASDLVGGVSIADREDQLAEVLLDLSMTKTINDSIDFGREVLAELQKIGPVHSERVEQAGFAVLKSPDIPSILVETAYITNPAEEKLLNNSSHQHKIAHAIVAGIKSYLEKNRSRYES